MKRTLSWRHHYLARLGIFLIIAALVVGTAGCSCADGGGGGDGGGESYTLTTASTAGGSVTTPGEPGPYTYDEGTSVNLVATADAGYEFDKWTGDTATIANPNDATTTIVMNGDYSITANFVLPGYTLTIASDVAGPVLTPTEGTHTYSPGTVVDLVAPEYNGSRGSCQFAYDFDGWTGDTAAIDNPGAATTTITMNGDYSIAANFQIRVEPMVSAGRYHTVGLMADGTAVATTITDSSKNVGQCGVGGWTDIIQVDAGIGHTVGLRADGTVVATAIDPSVDYGQSAVGDWTDIIQVAAGAMSTAGLRADGTVVSTIPGSPINDWTDIIQLDVCSSHIVGLKSNGKVVAYGLNDQGQCNVAGWTDIVQVAAGYYHTVGLRSDGTAVATLITDFGADCGQSDVTGSEWHDIVEIDAGPEHTVGRVHYTSGIFIISKAVATGNNNYLQCDVGGWTFLAQVSAGDFHTVGLKSDGTVVSTVVLDPAYDHGQCDVGGWDLD